MITQLTTRLHSVSKYAKYDFSVLIYWTRIAIVRSTRTGARSRLVRTNAWIKSKVMGILFGFPFGIVTPILCGSQLDDLCEPNSGQKTKVTWQTRILDIHIF